MINYIKANCKLPPLEAPLYDADSDTWDMWFEETPTPWHPYFPEPDLICLPFDTKEEAEATELECHSILKERKEKEDARKNTKKEE